VCLKDCKPGEVAKSVFCHGSTSYTLREQVAAVWVYARPVDPAQQAEPTRSYVANCPSTGTGSPAVGAKTSQPAASVKAGGSTTAATGANKTTRRPKRSSAVVSAKFVKAGSAGQ
jgi:hypothetical protein